MALDRRIWTYQTVAFQAFTDDGQPGVAPVYRFWSGTLGTHFYPISELERDTLMASYGCLWTYEGIAWYVV